MKKTRPKLYKIQKGRSCTRYRKAEAVQDTERSKQWKVQKGRSRMDLQPYKFAETYIIKKKKMGERKRRRKTRNVFLCTTDLELWRRRHLVHALQEEDKLVSQKQFYFQD